MFCEHEKTQHCIIDEKLILAGLNWHIQRNRAHALPIELSTQLGERKFKSNLNVREILASY